MSTTPSNLTTARRITPGDEAFLRRFRAEMKFNVAGPFVTLLDPIRPVKPLRDKAGNEAKQFRYIPNSAESWSVGSRLSPRGVAALVATFGREYNSVLDEEPAQKPKRRRGRRGGRKAAS